MEQKNGAVIRRLAGYGRYTTPAALLQLQKVYSLARLHTNFFQPVRKLLEKSREGARETRIYDEAQTPFQRMVESGAMRPARRAVLEMEYNSLNPLRLSRQIHRETAALLRMAERTGGEFR